MNIEQQHRLKQIRERWSQASFPEQVFTAHVKQDINLLLSLVDSQVAESDEWRTVAEKYQALVSRTEKDAATSMRSACIDAIKSLRAVPHGAAYNNAINDAIHKVESVTTQEQK